MSYCIIFLLTNLPPSIKYRSKVLAPLIGNSDSHVQNSQAFASFISTKVVHPDEILASIDVVSFFTRVPVELAVTVADSRLTVDDTLSSRTNLSVDNIICPLKFCLSNMSFCGQFFLQLHGTAMGSPVSVSVANLVMEDVEERALASYDVELPFWKRYVDDVCTFIPKKESLAFPPTFQ